MQVSPRSFLGIATKMLVLSVDFNADTCEIEARRV